MTKLYLRQGTAPTGTPSTEQSAALPVGTYANQHVTDPLSETKGVSQKNVLFTHVADQTHREASLHILGYELGSGVTSIDAQNWVIALAGGESNGNADTCFEISLYVWRPSNSSVVGYIIDTHAAINSSALYDELAAAVPPNCQGRVQTIAGSAVSGVQAGDLLVLEVWHHYQQLMSTAYQSATMFDGTTDPTDNTASTDAASYISSTQDLTVVGGLDIGVLQAAQHVPQGVGAFIEHAEIANLYAVDAAASLTTLDVSWYFAEAPPFEESIEVLEATDIHKYQSDYEPQQPRGPPWDTYAFVDQVEYLAEPIAEVEQILADERLEVDPQPYPDFFVWHHTPDQNEALIEPPPFQESIEVLIASDPMQGLELNPLPDPDFFQYNQPQEQNEWTAEPLASDEVMAAVDLQGLSLDPQPDPEFFQYNQPQDQAELAEPPPFEETIEALIAANPLPELLQPDPDFFEWDHRLDQHETLIPEPFVPPAEIAELIAANPIPHTQFAFLNPEPDFAVWDHSQEQNEAQSPRVTLSNTAEGGVHGDVVVQGSGGNTGGASGDYFDIENGNWTFAAADQAIDTLLYRKSAGSAFGHLEWTSPEVVAGGRLQRRQNQLFVRYYIWLPQYPTSSTNLLTFTTGDGAVSGLRINSSGMPFLFDRDTVYGGAGTIPLERWVRIEFWWVRGDQSASSAGNQIGWMDARFWFTDPNSPGIPDISLAAFGSGVDTGGMNNSEVLIGHNLISGGAFELFLDNLAVDTNDWIGPAGTAPADNFSPSATANAHPHDVVPPWQTDEFRLWEQQFDTPLYPEPVVPPASIEELIAANPIPAGQDPHPFPDFYEWNQPQEQNEVLSEVTPPPEASIEILVAADLMSSGHPPDLVSPALVFETYDQITHPSAGTIPPDLSGNIRRVPRWAKQRNFWTSGGR